jgi:hypothetical protein
MRFSSIARFWLIATPLFVAAVPAGAQLLQPPPSAPPSDSNLSFGGMLAKKPTPQAMPDVAAPPSAWPRLDAGAVLCRSQEDLQRRAAIMRGEQAGGVDCRPITQPTAIKIVHRAGPGSTEVSLTGRNETGWTDAWLPASPPPGTTPVNAGGLAGSNR